MLVRAGVGGSADGLIERVRPDLEAEHCLHVGACLSQAPAGLRLQVQQVVEPMMDLVGQALGEQVGQFVGGLAFDGALGYRYDRPDVEPGRLEPGVGGALTGAVDPHHGLEEPSIGDLGGLLAGYPRPAGEVEGAADLLPSLLEGVGEDEIDVTCLQGGERP